MLDVKKWGATSLLAQPLTVTTPLLQVPPGQGVRFGPLAFGDHFYLTISAGGVVERVRVTNVSGDLLTVVRGQDNTTPVAWARGACITFDWNPAQLCEFVAMCNATTSLLPTGVTPGTYCTNCTTCMTIGADGRVTSVVGAQAC